MGAETFDFMKLNKVVISLERVHNRSRISDISDAGEFCGRMKKQTMNSCFVYFGRLSLRALAICSIRRFCSTCCALFVFVLGSAVADSGFVYAFFAFAGTGTTTIGTTVELAVKSHSAWHVQLSGESVPGGVARCYHAQHVVKVANGLVLVVFLFTRPPDHNCVTRGLQFVTAACNFLVVLGPGPFAVVIRAIENRIDAGQFGKVAHVGNAHTFSSGQASAMEHAVSTPSLSATHAPNGGGGVVLVCSAKIGTNRPVQSPRFFFACSRYLLLHLSALSRNVPCTEQTSWPPVSGFTSTLQIQVGVCIGHTVDPVSV